MVMAFQDFFNRAAEQRDRALDIEQQRVNLGMPRASESPAQDKPLGQGPATTPETDEQRRFNFGERSPPADNAAPASDIKLNTLDFVTGRVSPGYSYGNNFKMGTARVPGKGDGTKDTVPAKLAPGEAVLNKAAADKMGRGLIAALNKMGAQKMGLV